MNTRPLGQMGENAAVAYLKANGFTILERNFRTKLGEIDVIARDKGTLCFIEVKARQSLSRGEPYESVHFYKQRKMARVAQVFMKYKFNSVDIMSRFDVISVYQDPQGQCRVEHIRSAFDLTMCKIF